jgi:phosphotriesterase-related protein
MTRMVNTVTGPVSSEQLGAVLVHEHVAFGYPGFQGDESFDAWEEDKFFAEITPVIERIKAQGIKTIVDATANDCGRNVTLLKKVSEQCGINIICSTGYYYEKGGANSYWNFRRSFGFPAQEEVYGLMQHEFNQGIGKTGIKAGTIKLGTGNNEFTDYEKMFFTAACRLAREDPNVRIITHCTHGTMLKEQAEFFMQEEVNPKQVQLGHFGDTVDLTVQIDVLEKGFYAGFDRMGQGGFDGMPYDDDRMAAICALTASGFGDQILLSNDRIYWFFGRKVDLPQTFVDSCLSNWNWTYIFDKVLPKLKCMGLSEEQTHKMMFENPQKFYGGE